MEELIIKALHAAEQNMTDVLAIYNNPEASNMTLGIAIRDMKNDGLKLVKQARAAIANAPNS